MNKLSLADVQLIRIEYASGKHSCRTLAKKYGVCKTHIAYVLNSKRWKRVPIPYWLELQIQHVKERNIKFFRTA
jgi:hypothetical protein